MKLSNLTAAIIFAAAAFASPLAASASTVSQIETITANAQAAKDNAAIYQWKRVNLEVDRIVAAEKALENANEAISAPGSALRMAILDLRAARLNHDSEATQSAVDAVLAAAK